MMNQNTQCYDEISNNKEKKIQNNHDFSMKIHEAINNHK